MTNPELLFSALSPEVQDFLNQAKRKYRLENTTQLTDTQLLSHTLKQCRWLSSESNLIKALHLNKPSQLVKQINQQDASQSILTFLQVGQSPSLKASELIKNETLIPEKTSTTELFALLLLSDAPSIEALKTKQDQTIEAPLVSHALKETKKNYQLKSTLFYLKETIELILTVLLWVLAIKFFVGELRVIPSESMLQTLQINDRVLVEKITYWFSQPKRGDIVVFYPPEPETILHNDPMSWVLRVSGISSFLNKPESLVDRAFIKRTIGLPGDKLEVISGQGIKINDVLIDEPYVNEIALGPCTMAIADLNRDTVISPDNETIVINGKPYDGPELIGLKQNPTQLRTIGNYLFYCGPIRIPKESYFMMGDNRNHSHDSRYWGVLTKDRIIGKASLRVWPWDNRFGQILPAPPKTSELAQ